MISKMGNGFFGTALLAVAMICPAQRPENRVSFHENKLSIVLEPGWKNSDKNADTALAGFESSDQRSSMFINLVRAADSASMPDIMDVAVANYEKVFDVKKVGEYKTGQVQGPDKKWSAIYVQIELEMKTSRDPIPFRFYVMLFDTGTQFYQIQASTMTPVREVREKEIFKMMSSIIAKR